MNRLETYEKRETEPNHGHNHQCNKEGSNNVLDDLERVFSMQDENDTRCNTYSSKNSINDVDISAEQVQNATSRSLFKERHGCSHDSV